MPVEAEFTMNVKELRDIIERHCLLRDRYRLRRLFKKLESVNFSDPALMAELEKECDEAKFLFDLRISSVPVLTYPEELPVSERKEEILEAVKKEQV